MPQKSVGPARGVLQTPDRPSVDVVWRDAENDAELPQEFQRLGDVAEQVVACIARRHGLPLPTAGTVCRLAGLGGAQ